MQEPFTAEQIEWLDQRYGRKAKDSEAVRMFRKDIATWVEQSKNRNVSPMTIQNGLYGAIRLKLGLRSMNALNDDKLPEARKVFEDFKNNFGN